MKKLLSNFAGNESGATAIEYGLIAAGIAVVIIAMVQLAGQNLLATWTQIAGAMAPGGGGGGGGGGGTP